MPTQNNLSAFRRASLLQMNLKKILCTLSGDDYGIISRCGAKIENRFARIGLYIAAVFALCFAGCYLAFSNLFPNNFVGIALALFFAWMITNIYLLLLYTLSKNVLPHKTGRKTRIVSIILRTLFICFIAVVVSKPLEALIFSGALHQEIAQYKREKLAEYVIGIEEFYDGETTEFQQMIENQKKLDGTARNETITKYQRLLDEKDNEKAQSLTDTRRSVENSNYYIYGITLLNTKYPSCWFLTLLSISIFLAPAALKNFISTQSDYYRRKRKIEINIVREEYLEFKVRYRRLLREKFDAEKNFSEPYTDAPFNTILKTDSTTYLPESMLLAELYDA